MLGNTTISVNGYWNTRLQEVVDSGMRQSKAQIVSEALEFFLSPRQLYIAVSTSVFTSSLLCRQIFVFSI